MRGSAAAFAPTFGAGAIDKGPAHAKHATTRGEQDKGAIPEALAITKTAGELCIPAVRLVHSI